MKNVLIDTRLEIPDSTQEQAIAEKIQALVVEVRALIPATDNYSIFVSLINDTGEDEDGQV